VAPVCAWDLPEFDDGVETLVGLVDKSLVVSDQSGSGVRYRLLETIREYALERLESSGQADAVRRRHAAYFQSLARAGGMTRRGVWYTPDLELIGREHDNMRAALGAMLSLADFSDGLALCRVLGGFWLSQGYLSEAEEWLHRFLAHADSIPWELVADGLHTAGRTAEYRGAFDVAQAYLLGSLRVAMDNRSINHIARALFGLGSVAAHHGDYARARGYFQEGLALDRNYGILPDVAEALVALARIESIRGEPSLSRSHFEEAVAIQRQLGDAWSLAYVLNELGQQARDDHELERAQALEEEAHALWTQSGSRVGQRAALMNLAVITFERADLPRARELAQEMLQPSSMPGERVPNFQFRPRSSSPPTPLLPC